MSLQEKILQRMRIYYNNEEKVQKWFVTPNQFFSYDLTRKVSPKDMIENGEGEQVWEWIKITIGD